MQTAVMVEILGPSEPAQLNFFCHLCLELVCQHIRLQRDISPYPHNKLLIA